MSVEINSDVEINSGVVRIIYDFFKMNDGLDEEDINMLHLEIKQKGNELIVLNLLKTKYPDKYTEYIDLAYQHKLFTKEAYNQAERLLAEFLEGVNKEVGKIVDIQEDIIEENEPEEEIVEKPTPKPKIKKEIKVKKGKIFTEAEIKALIDAGENLYKHIPGNQVPKTDNRFYVEIQLKRFIDSGGSDFIIETQKKNGMIYNMIRFRISGVHETQDKTDLFFPTDSSKGNENEFFETVRKYVGGSLGRMNADLKHVDQDSSFSLDYRNESRDFRSNTLPTRCIGTPYPRYCLRLTSKGDEIDFNKIELLPFLKDFLLNIIHNKKPGMIAFTGPTGSGKTTTIYGVLNEIDKEKYSVLAIEKPIESQVHGINQTEEDTIERDKRDSYTNKDFMKSILRQAGDVLFIGEMRDAEETRQGVKTGLVGNKLITTFHTNSAVDTILRLKEEGVTNNAIGNGVKNIIAQRLVRKVCTHCSTSSKDSEKQIKKIKKIFNRAKTYFRVELKELLNKLPLEELNNIDMLEIQIGDNLNFVSKEDLELMIDLIDDNIEKYNSIKLKAKKIEFLLELYKDFPTPSLRKWIDEQIKNAVILEANPEGCTECKEGYSLDRIMIAEGLAIDKTIKRFIQDPESKLIDLEKFLLNKGFLDMRMYGYLLVMQGITTLETIDEVCED